MHMRKTHLAAGASGPLELSKGACSKQRQFPDITDPSCVWSALVAGSTWECQSSWEEEMAMRSSRRTEH